MRVSKENIERVDALIPEAARYVDTALNVNTWVGGPGRNSLEWSRVFMDKMNELTIAAGLRVSFDEYLV